MESPNPLPKQELKFSLDKKLMDFDDPEVAFVFLVDRLKTYLSEADIEVVEKAYRFGAFAHKGQTRSSGEPYITHPLTVAIILTDLKLDLHSIVAAILHDVVEDTEYTLEDIGEKFGQEVSGLVDGLTKISKIKFQSKQQRLAENFRKMILAMAKDIRVILVKLADRLHNMSTLATLSRAKQERIAQETLEIYAPLAGRLGIYGIKSELEDLCLRYTKEEVYQDIKSKIALKKQIRASYITDVVEVLEKELKSYGLKNFYVYGRPKHFYSIYKKMIHKRVDVDDIFDLFAFRVIVDSVKDCYEVLGIVHSLWKPMPGRFKDYIAMPKPNMYQSLHTTVIKKNGDPAEIQIRTQQMHKICEYGVATHWAYKEGATPKGKTPSSTDIKKFSWMKQMMQWQSELQDPDEFLQAVKVDLFEEEIFIFTPGGDVLALPIDASCLDFAFSVHTDVGLKTTGVKVNGRMVPIKSTLKSGDIVEVITSKNQRPNKDWLKIVRTSKARNKIRSYLRSEQRKKVKALGVDLLNQYLTKIDRDVESIRSSKEADSMVKTAREGNFDDMLISIGYGKIDLKGLLAKVFPNSYQPKEEAEEKIKSVQKKSSGKGDENGITVSGMDNILVYMARCCNPLPGEPILGFITRGRGVSVHRLNCDRALDLDPQRKIEVSWKFSKSKALNHSAFIRVHTHEKPGVLAEVTAVIAATGANISKAQINVNADMTGQLDFEVSVRSLEQLNLVLRKLEGLSFVYNVKRCSDFNPKKF